MDMTLEIKKYNRNLMPTKEIINDATMELALRDAKRDKIILVLSYRGEDLETEEGKEAMKQFN